MSNINIDTTGCPTTKDKAKQARWLTNRLRKDGFKVLVRSDYFFGSLIFVFAKKSTIDSTENWRNVVSGDKTFGWIAAIDTSVFFDGNGKSATFLTILDSGIFQSSKILDIAAIPAELTSINDKWETSNLDMIIKEQIKHKNTKQFFQLADEVYCEGFDVSICEDTDLYNRFAVSKNADGNACEIATVWVCKNNIYRIDAVVWKSPTTEDQKPLAMDFGNVFGYLADLAKEVE